MNIRQKLTWLFLALSFAILAICFGIILFTQSNYREEQFKERLEVKAQSIEEALIDGDEFGNNQLRLIQRSSTQLFQEQIYIVDESGHIMFSSPSIAPQFPLESALIHKAQEKASQFFIWKDFECCSILSQKTSRPILIIVAGYDQYGHNKVSNLRELLIILLLVSLIISAFLGWFYAGKALSPISEIMSQVDEITAGNLNARLDEGKQIDELARLSITFNRMLNRIEAAFEAQKTFVSNASHELRTPLTIISGRLELALIRGKDEEEYENAIKEVLADVRHLNQICTSLLILAQSNNKRDNIRFIPVRIDELIWQVRSEFLKMNPDARVEVTFAGLPEEDSDLTLLGNEQLLKTAAINLIDNACKFSSNHTVKIGLHFTTEEISLSFTDDGPGISQSEIPNLIYPFYRGKQIVDKQGFGLGLAMVESIIKLHKGHLEINSIVGTGSTFNMILPK